ncbi:MAG TPA: hypothetical protein VF068_02165 [Rubrobacter sp.]
MMHHGALLLLLIFLAAGVGLKGPLLLIRVISKHRSSHNFSLHAEDEIKALDCSYCGYHVEGADDEELFDQFQIHIDQNHPDLRLTDEEIGGLVASGAYDPAYPRPSRD